MEYLNALIGNTEMRDFTKIRTINTFISVFLRRSRAFAEKTVRNFAIGSVRFRRMRSMRFA